MHDPLADPAEAASEYGLTLDANALDGRYAAILLAVPHDAYRTLTRDRIAGLLDPEGLLVDLKRFWKPDDLPADVRRWTL